MAKKFAAQMRLAVTFDQWLHIPEEGVAEAGIKRADWFCKVKGVVYKQELGKFGPGPKFGSKGTSIREG